MTPGSKPRSAAACLIALVAACAGPIDAAPATQALPITLYGAFMAGNYAAAAGHEATAARFFAQAIKLDPANPALLHQAFVTALMAHRPDTPALAARLPNDPLALMVRANAAIKAKNYPKAAILFTAIPPIGVIGLLRPLLIAWARAGSGDYGPAIDGLKALDPAAPFGPVDALNAAMIADLAGREAEAAPLYAMAERAFPAPNLRLAQAIASFQARQGNHQRADAILSRMAASHPDLRLALRTLETNAAQPMIASPRDGVAEAYLTLAGSLGQPQQLLLRQILLGFALDLRPDLAAARLLQANIDAATAKPARAARQLAKIGPADPLYGPALMQRGQILDAHGQAAGLLPALAALARAHPRQSAPLTLAGDIERDAKHYTAASALYSRALARLGPNPPARAWVLYYGRAICEDKRGDWPAADADLHRALAAQPGQPFVLNYLGYSYALRGEHLIRAQNMIEQALQVDPNEGAIIDSLGYVLLRRGKIAHAMRVQIRAVHKAPDDAEVNAHLATIFAAAGDHLAARNQWARALALHPGKTEAAKIEAELKRDQAGS